MCPALYTSIKLFVPWDWKAGFCDYFLIEQKSILEPLAPKSLLLIKSAIQLQTHVPLMFSFLQKQMNHCYLETSLSLI